MSLSQRIYVRSSHRGRVTEEVVMLFSAERTAEILAEQWHGAAPVA